MYNYLCISIQQSAEQFIHTCNITSIHVIKYLSCDRQDTKISLKPYLGFNNIHLGKHADETGR